MQKLPRSVCNDSRMRIKRVSKLYVENYMKMSQITVIVFINVRYGVESVNPVAIKRVPLSSRITHVLI